MKQALDDLKALRDEIERLSHAIETHGNDTFGLWAEILADAISTLEVARERACSATAGEPAWPPLAGPALQWSNPFNVKDHFWATSCSGRIWSVCPDRVGGGQLWRIDGPLSTFADKGTYHATPDEAMAECQRRERELFFDRLKAESATTNGAASR